MSITSIRPLLFFGALLSLSSLVGCDFTNEVIDRSIVVRADADLGDVLIGNRGRTLYVFANEPDGTPACLGPCLDSWPVFHVEELILDPRLNDSDFQQITRPDGLPQVTYKGWPLYNFAPNGDGRVESTRSVLGDGVGGVWFAAKPDYGVLVARQQLVGADGNNYLEDGTLGDAVSRYLTGPAGNTLYRFSGDAFNTNNFTAPDFSNDGIWPVYFENGTVPSTYDTADFDVIDVFGRQQLTFKGWPLYTFFADEARGDTKGVSQPAPGTFLVVNGATEEAPAGTGDGGSAGTEGGGNDGGDNDDDGYGYGDNP
ncbi:MAG: hypothetical protein AAF624_02145 [Bacteroidota bacterium]